MPATSDYKRMCEVRNEALAQWLYHRTYLHDTRELPPGTCTSLAEWTSLLRTLAPDHPLLEKEAHDTDN